MAFQKNAYLVMERMQLHCFCVVAAAEVGEGLRGVVGEQDLEIALGLQIQRGYSFSSGCCEVVMLVVAQEGRCCGDGTHHDDCARDNHGLASHQTTIPP